MKVLTFIWLIQWMKLQECTYLRLSWNFFLHQSVQKLHECTYGQLTGKFKSRISVRCHHMITLNWRMCNRPLTNIDIDKIIICIWLNLLQLFHMVIEIKNLISPRCKLKQAYTFLFFLYLPIRFTSCETRKNHDLLMEKLF